MGTINYKTSEYITLGIKPYDFDDIKAAIESEQDEHVSDALVYDYINEYYEDDIDNTKSVLQKYNFDYFDIDIDYGYYEGFCLLIEPKFDFYAQEEKSDALKEADELKELLKELAGNGLVACYPGWSTGYADYNKTLKEIDDAIEEIKKDINETELSESKIIKNRILAGVPVRKVTTKVLKSDSFLESSAGGYIMNKKVNESTGTASQSIEIELFLKPGTKKETAEAVIAKVKDLLSDADDVQVDFDLDSSQGAWLYFSAVEYFKFYYSPEVHTGIMTGSPEEYDDDRIYTEDYLNSELKDLGKEYDFEIDSDTVKCKDIDDYDPYYEESRSVDSAVTESVKIFDSKATVKGSHIKFKKSSVNLIVSNILSGTPVKEALGMFGEDDSFFTKDELLEFASSVVDDVNDYYKSVNSPFSVDYTGAWIENDDRTITVDFVCFPNETNYSISVKVDLRSIQSPNDLFKYVSKMVEALKKQISAEEVIESKSIFESASDIKEAFAVYTGGNIWLFYGKLKDGTWFLTDDYGDTLILDADPSNLDVSTYQEWQDEHKIKELSGKELEKFDDDLLDKLLSYPSNDYKHTGGIDSDEIEGYRKYFKSI